MKVRNSGPNDRIEHLAGRNRLASWNSFVEELDVPADLMPALVTMRPELLRLAPRRVLTAEEHDVLLRLLAGLLDTNIALQAHAQDLAEMTKTMDDTIRGLGAMTLRLRRYANFQKDE